MQRLTRSRRHLPVDGDGHLVHARGQPHRGGRGQRAGRPHLRAGPRALRVAARPGPAVPAPPGGGALRHPPPAVDRGPRLRSRLAPARTSPCPRATATMPRPHRSGRQAGGHPPRPHPAPVGDVDHRRDRRRPRRPADQGPPRRHRRRVGRGADGGHPRPRARSPAPARARRALDARRASPPTPSSSATPPGRWPSSRCGPHGRPGARSGVALKIREQNRQPHITPPPSPFSAPPTSLNGPLTAERSFAASSLSLADGQGGQERVRLHGQRRRADHVRRGPAPLLRRSATSTPTVPLVAMVPVSVRTEDQKGTHGNQVSMMLTSLATDLDDPVERLDVVHASTVVAKEQQNAIGADTLQEWAEFAAPAIFGRAARLYSNTRSADRHRPIFNVTISNVPGPPFPLYVAGAQVLDTYPMGPIFDGGGAQHHPDELPRPRRLRPGRLPRPGRRRVVDRRRAPAGARRAGGRGRRTGGRGGGAGDRHRRDRDRRDRRASRSSKAIEAIEVVEVVETIDVVEIIDTQSR